MMSVSLSKSTVSSNLINPSFGFRFKEQKAKNELAEVTTAVSAADKYKVSRVRFALQFFFNEPQQSCRCFLAEYLSESIAPSGTRKELDESIGGRQAA